MADNWVVTPTSVTLNGSAIIGYVSHALVVRNNQEGKPFSETSLYVRIIDPHSEAAREAPLAPLLPAERNMVLAEYANHPTASEWRSKAGDTIVFSGSVVEGTGIQPGGSLAGSDVL